MSREIAFKVWDGEKMISLSRAISLDIVGVQESRDDCFELEPYFEGVHLLQYTGLTDKNGQKIFEGDIVEYDSINVGGKLGVVTFKIANFVIEFPDEEGMYIQRYFFPKIMEVIGNIYDNPELLEVERNEIVGGKSDEKRRN